MEEARTEMFPNGTKVEESSLKTKFRQKLKLFAQILGKPVDSGKKSGGGGVVFTFYSIRQSLCFTLIFVKHNPLLHLQNQGNYFNNGVNHNEQYRRKEIINKHDFIQAKTIY